jgi:triacylglycerol lipase
MIARLQRWLTLGLIALTIGLAGAAWAADRHALAGAIALVALTGHAAVLAIEFALMHAVNRHDPAARARWGAVLRAWAWEALHAPRVFCWRQPFRSQRLADDPGTGRTGHAGPGVLLIHGFVCNRGLWNRWMQRLREDGVPFIAVNLEPAFGSIDQYPDHIERAVAQLARQTGRPPLVVAHSMGGLALRRWWMEPGNNGRIAHAITLGSPHHGTWLARLALSPNARQMRLQSEWLQRLAADEPADRASRMTCFFSTADNIVFPASSATLPGADNRLLSDGVPHVAMVDDPRPWQELQRRVQG